MTRFNNSRKKTKKDNSKLWLGLFIVIIMVSSGFAVMLGGFNNGSSKKSYNGFDFTTTQDGYVTEVDGTNVGFPFLPQQVEYLNVSDDVIQKLKASPQIDLTSFPESDYKHEVAQAQFYLDQSMVQNFNTYIRKGFATENEFDLPIITCNSSSDVPVILFEEANDTEVTTDGNCIKIRSANGEGFLWLSTRILYGVYGVI